MYSKFMLHLCFIVFNTMFYNKSNNFSIIILAIKNKFNGVISCVIIKITI